MSGQLIMSDQVIMSGLVIMSYLIGNRTISSSSVASPQYLATLEEIIRKAQTTAREMPINSQQTGV